MVMAIVMEALYTEIQQPSEFDLIAELQYGNNGNYGAPEVAAGVPADHTEDGHIVWDTNIYDGLDSTYVPVQMVVRTTPEETLLYWSVFGQEVMYLGAGYNKLTQLEIRSGVDSTQASIEWIDLDVCFFKEGNVIDQWIAQEGPSVDRTEEYGTTEHILTLSPEAYFVDEIQLSGYVRLRAPQGTYLDVASVFSQVVIKGEPSQA
jgi:hypothetical protein